MQIGYKLSTEGFGPEEIVRQAVAAEAAGFDFVEMSDHFHPWLSSQEHSPSTWVLMGMLAAKTSTIGLVTGVTCPSFRYHPAIVAQMAATLQIVSGGRFTLGVGSGERLNEHITGQEFPSVSRRHERLEEALRIIRLLWEGGYQSFEGTHLQLDDARVFDLPERLPEICVAVSGPASVRLAAGARRRDLRGRARPRAGARASARPARRGRRSPRCRCRTRQTSSRRSTPRSRPPGSRSPAGRS